MEKKRNLGQSEPPKVEFREKVSYRHQGKEIILPEYPTPMTIEEAIDSLYRIRKEEEQEVTPNAEFRDALPLEGAYALQQVLARRYGWTTTVPTPSFFGPKPPSMVSLQISPTESVQVIWGSFKLPGVPGRLQTVGDQDSPTSPPYFRLAGKTQRKYEKEINEIVEETRKQLMTDSVYKGKALSLNWDNDNQCIKWDNISFIDLSKANKDALIFSDDVRSSIETNLWTPITHTQACRDSGIPIKRGVLLEGAYGTGKTMCAHVTAAKAHAAGWTFILLPRVQALTAAIRFASSYQPCVIFAEDIDRVIFGEERTVSIDEILNTVDGMVAKQSEMMVVLTTNHVEQLHKAMLRPGRIDAVISIKAPDAPAIESLIRSYGQGAIAPEADLTQAGKLLEGQIPAFVREVVERAKLRAVFMAEDGQDITISTDAITAAAKDLRNHIELVQGKTKDAPRPAKDVVKDLGGLISGASEYVGQ